MLSVLLTALPQISKMIIVLLLFFLSSTRALPGGAPTSVCQTMLPNHGGGLPPQVGLSPYSIVPRRQGDTVLVSVGSTLGVRFQGFLLQGRTPSGDVLGEFDRSSTSEGHTIDCAEPRDSLTHVNPSPKESLEVIWKPPRGFEGEVIFNATIAQSYDTFWLGVVSPPVQITKRAVDDPIPNNPIYPNRQTTTHPNFVPEIHREAATDFDPFYDGCSANKLCFGDPANCVNSRNCKAVVAVTVTGDRYDFELKAINNAAWVGVGLSDDNKMGDDSVIECVKRGNGVAAYMSWTSSPPSAGAARLSNPQLGIQVLNSSIIEDVIYCKVRRDAVTNVRGQTFNLIDDQYYLLIAAGSSVKADSVSYHDLSFSASGEKRALSDVSALAAASKILVRLHGSFMLAAWIGTASVGILLARYYRQTWVGTSLMGKDLWFAWHRIFMVLTWCLTIAAFVLIFVELKDWSRENNPHAILGTITTILCFFQPIGAYFRPHPGTSRRPIFNWAHWFVGNAAHIIGIVAIFFAVKLTKAELPEYVDWILVAYVAVHVVTHLLLSVMGCISEKSSDGRIMSFPMKDLGGSGRSSAYADRNADAPFSPFRKFLLAIYILIVLALVVALIVIIALAPIGDTITFLKSSIQSN